MQACGCRASGHKTAHQYVGKRLAPADVNKTSGGAQTAFQKQNGMVSVKMVSHIYRRLPFKVSHKMSASMRDCGGVHHCHKRVSSQRRHHHPLRVVDGMKRRGLSQASCFQHVTTSLVLIHPISRGMLAVGKIKAVETITT